METVLSMKAFDPKNQSGIIFSVFDCIKTGATFRVISDSSLGELKNTFAEANVTDVVLNESKLPNGQFEVSIKKIESSAKSGCCGGCGG